MICFLLRQAIQAIRLLATYLDSVHGYHLFLMIMVIVDDDDVDEKIVVIMIDKHNAATP